jgi:hypothetical protein
MKNTCLGALALTAVLMAGNASAADGLRPVLGLAITGGGEKLATVQYTDGSSQNVKSGGLVHLFGGVEFDAESWALQANIGYHVDDTTARNGSVKFSRLPVELLGFWKPDAGFRIGAGVRKANSPKVTSSGAAASLGNLDLDSEIGAIVQGEYFFGSQGSLYLRFVAEDYKVPGSAARISGNHVALGAAFRF